MAQGSSGRSPRSTVARSLGPSADNALLAMIDFIVFVVLPLPVFVD